MLINAFEIRQNEQFIFIEVIKKKKEEIVTFKFTH